MTTTSRHALLVALIAVGTMTATMREHIPGEGGPIGLLSTSKKTYRSPRPPPVDSSITITAVGDILLGSLHPESVLPPKDGARMFARVDSVLKTADVAIGNLEGPLLDGASEQPIKSNGEHRWAFRMPVRYAALLKRAGFDVISFANNHCMDFGQRAVRRTLSALDSAGLVHCSWRGDVARITIRGRRIATIAFSPNTLCHDLRDLATARTLVAALAGGADIVVVSFHGGGEGAEYQHVTGREELFLDERRGNVRAFAHAVIDAGADLVVGHGPHVLRGMEVYHNRLIAYSLGNFATWRNISVAGLGGITMILTSRLGSDGTFIDGRITPVWQRPPGVPELDARSRAIPLVRRLSQEDFGDDAVRITDDGAVKP